MKVYGNTLDDKCPSDFAPRRLCFYIPHTFVENLSVTEGLTKVVIELGLRKVELPVQEIHKPVQQGLTICVQPVYYYTQWQNIVLYIEAWRAQGATRFIVFYHSSTKDTRKVLDYYKDLGIIELRPWGSFGNLHKDIVDKKPIIDNNAYLFSYILASNICILDIKTTLGAAIDFDEIIVPINGTMLDYASKEMTGTDVGALLFESNYVAMNPSIYTSDFSGISSPSFYRKGLNKFIFNVSVIDLCETHYAKSFIDKSKITKDAAGLVLHMRFNVKDFDDVPTSKPIHFFPNDTSQHIQNMHKTIQTIFGSSPPSVPMDSLNVFVECGLRQFKQGMCHGAICKPDMDAVHEWVYDKTEGMFLAGEY